MGKAWLFKETKANGRQGTRTAKKEATHMNTTHDIPETEDIPETAYNRAQRRAAINDKGTITQLDPSLTTKQAGNHGNKQHS